MPKRTVISVAGIILLAVFALEAAQGKEYFTEGEIDLIRDAQAIDARTIVFLKLADNRLFELRVKEKTKAQIDQERKEREKREKEARDAAKAARTSRPGTAPEPPPQDAVISLGEFSRSELLRGYSEALDEAMDNIDDAYSNRINVRNPLEELDKYARETLPFLEKFQPANASEKTALEEALEKTRKAGEDSSRALKIVPKTEQQSPAK